MFLLPAVTPPLAACSAVSCPSASTPWLLSCTPSPGPTPTSPWSPSACWTPCAAPRPSWSASRCVTWSRSWSSPWRRYCSHRGGEGAAWGCGLICVPGFGLALGAGGSDCALSHPGRLEIRVSLSPHVPHELPWLWQFLHVPSPVGTWGSMSTLPWELPCPAPCGSRSCFWGHPSLEAVWGQATKPAAEIVLVGSALVPLPRFLPPLSCPPHGLVTHHPKEVAGSPEAFAGLNLVTPCSLSGSDS